MTQTATTLAADVTIDAEFLSVVAAISDELDFGYLIQLDSELLTVEYRGQARDPGVRRGAYGSTPATHSAGATVTPVQLVVQTDAPTAPPPATAGGAPSSIYVSADDPGAIGARNLWLEVVFADGAGDGGDGRLWARNSTDTGWNSASPLTFSDATTTLIASPSDASEVVLNDSGGSHVSDPTSFYVNGGGKEIFVDVAGLHLGGSGATPLVISATTPNNPRAGGGLAAPRGSLLILDIAGSGTSPQLWLKHGAGDTAWSYISQIAAPETIADLAGDADLPTAVAKVNELLGMLRSINVVG